MVRAQVLADPEDLGTAYGAMHSKWTLFATLFSTVADIIYV